MNCPGHMLLFGSRPAAPTATCRCATPRPRRCTATSWPARCTACSRVRYVTQDDAHIFCSRRADRRRDRRLPRLRGATSTTSSGSSRAPSSRRGPSNKLGTDEEWDFTEGALERGAGAARDRVLRRTRARAPFYGPKIDLHMTDVLGRSWQMGTIQLDAQMPAALRAHLHGRRQPRAPGPRDPPRAARLARALHRHPRRALRRRVPVLARARAGAPDPGRRGASRGRRRAARAHRGRGLPRRGRRSATRRSAGGSATPSSRRSRTSSSTATASPTSSLAVRERGGGQSTRSLAELLRVVRRRACYDHA